MDNETQLNILTLIESKIIISHVWQRVEVLKQVF